MIGLFGRPLDVGVDNYYSMVNENCPFKVIIITEKQNVLSDIKYRKHDSKNYVAYFSIPKDLSKIDTINLKIIIKNIGKVHDYYLVFDRETDKILDNNSDKNNVNFVDYTIQQGLIRLKEKFLIMGKYKISIRWNKSGLKYIAIHY